MKPEKLQRNMFWDTAGQERYFSIVKLYFKNARGIICVYDINDINTLKIVQVVISSKGIFK